MGKCCVDDAESSSRIAGGFRVGRFAWGVFALGWAVCLAPVDGAEEVRKAEPKVDLKWRLQADDQLRYLLEQKTIVRQTVGDRELTTDVDVALTFRWNVEKIDEQGTAHLAQVIERARFQIDAPALKIDFDTGKELPPAGSGPAASGPQAPPPAVAQPSTLAADAVGRELATVFKAMLGGKFRFRLSPRGELSDFQSPDALTRHWKNNPSAGNLGSLFTADGLRQIFTEAVVRFPAEPVTRSTPWSHSSVSPAPPLGEQKLDTELTYMGSERRDGRRLQMIELQGRLTLTPGPDPLTKVEIRSQSALGAVAFDADSGRLFDSLYDQTAEMLLTRADRSILQTIHTVSTMKLLANE